MTSLWLAAFLGAVQGVTEFLPVSSTGHLVVFANWFGLAADRFGLTFNAAVHLGTLVALLACFGGDLWRMAVSRSKWLSVVVVGTVPAAVAGWLFEDFVREVLERPVVVGVSLIGFSLVLVAAEKWGKRRGGEEAVGVKEGWWVGVAQAVALIPGVSRSGITIAFGMFLGLRREVAAKLAFLLSIPIVAGAGGKELLGVLGRGGSGDDWQFFVVGMMSAAVSGYVAVRWLLKFLERGSLMPFVWYRLVLGMGVLLGG